MIDSAPHTSADADHVSSKRFWAHRLVEPGILFSGLALLTLAAIWLVTLNLVEREQQAADRRAALLAADAAETYEAQIVRALREIDTTLQLVRYSLDDRPAQETLEDLRQRGMLPPALLFEVRISDAEGNITASTHTPTLVQDAIPTPEQEEMVIGLSRQEVPGEVSRLAFSRNVADSDQGEPGRVTLLVSATYFVSGYELDTLGEHGLLALLGADGTFLVRRTGDMIGTGGQVDKDTLLDGNSALDEPARVRVNEWDGVHRYTVARSLFEFPVAIVLGLSKAEQMAAAEALRRSYYWRAALISLIALSVLALLGRLSWKLRQTQARILEERLDHARRAEYLAFHDNLTGLPNRAFFSHLLIKCMQ